MQNVKKGVIAICDDQEYILQELRELIETICAAHGACWEVRTYLSGKELLEHLSELSVVFLDIEMPEMDGIELGRIIRKSKPNCKIIMATGTVERFKDAFQIQAMRFVTKPFERAEVEDALLATIGDSLDGETLEIYKGRNRYEIHQADIQYIEAFNGYAEIKAGDNFFRKDVSLDNLEKKLDERLFVRVSRKIIVNLRYVQGMKNLAIKVEDKEVLISRRRLNTFKHKYVEFDLKYRGKMGW